ncbi:MAG: Stp1/IreP family PP2C-type Ser/Thr phosphatase [Pseudobdellovibrionaceae bacterium]
MELNVWCTTDKGLKRETNQDSYLIDEDLGLFIVADGMGGHLGGEVASSMAVETVQIIVRENRDIHPQELLKMAYREASQRIFDKATENAPHLTGMGTTMVLSYLRGKTLFIGNVGDSRSYFYKNEMLWLLTEDHSLINEQIRAGLITEEQARSYANKNIITRSVGYERDVDCDVIEREVQKGEIYIFCSDGLSGLVPFDDILKIIQNVPTERLVGKLIDQAKANGGDDNVTVMVLEFS